MPSKKSKAKVRQTKSKSTAAKRKSTTKAKKKAMGAGALKKSSKKKATLKKTTARTSRGRKRQGSVSAERELQRDIRGRRVSTPEAIVGQSGDLQGLSRAEQSDSESVEELVEEGNVFEAGVVAGVEESDDADEREVYTHEVLEDDVPEEYLDKD